MLLFKIYLYTFIMKLFIIIVSNEAFSKNRKEFFQKCEKKKMKIGFTYNLYSSIQIFFILKQKKRKIDVKK